ncbi:uncharacterized protein BDR25DRAFT_396181 [Lindgomyces ingoldianus]|uniref:Uncharacterized protein n=1 Tax=Lindgomyces ingoldianus TaxID=673940 RepID=A0ACB6QF07_9PLEO|nr:uncharacterized protein BDR25DRAFT_396181 [Lindgomyces ingoldianus]KAF2465482.1 hypothetical protein BDR25DRAFT_396181 [Lindgomyces ingoldianus]
MFQYSICAFLAPAVVSAMAFPWAGPEPTLIMPEEDRWSPRTTPAPKMELMELFKRAAGDNTCGYISGDASRSLTCNNSNYVCATNTYYGVHGCCDPKSISTCSIPTTCIPSSLMSASCTDAACSTNDYIAKCTDSDAPYCYQWRYVYSTRTVMTEFGCASSAFTVSVQRTSSGEATEVASSKSELQISYITVTPSSKPASSSVSNSGNAQSVTQSASASATSQPEKKSKTNIGAIVGGVVGGLVVIGAIAFGAIFLILRNRKKGKDDAANAAVTQPMMGQGPAPGVTEYKPQPGGFPSPGQQYPPAAAGGYFNHDQKPYNPQMGVPGQEMHPYSPPTSPAPQYSGPVPLQPQGPEGVQGVPMGVAEAGGSPVNHSPPPQQPGQPGAPVQQPPPQHQIYEAP